MTVTWEILGQSQKKCLRDDKSYFVKPMQALITIRTGPGGCFDGRKKSLRRNWVVFDLDVTASLKTGILWDAWIKQSIVSGTINKICIIYVLANLSKISTSCVNEILITFRTSIKKIKGTFTLGVCSKCDKNINYNTWVCLFFWWFFFIAVSLLSIIWEGVDLHLNDLHESPFIHKIDFAKFVRNWTNVSGRGL